MRILRVVHERGGGLGSDVDLLDEELLRLDGVEAVHLVFHATTDWPEAGERTPGRILRPLPRSEWSSRLGRRFSLSAHRAVWRALRQVCAATRIDLVHSHSPLSLTGFTTALFAAWRGLPLVQTFHGSRDPRRLHALLQRAFLFFPARLPSVRLAISRAAAEVWGPAASEALVVGVPVDHARFATAAAHVPARARSAESPFVFLMPARITWVKNQIIVPRLARALRAALPAGLHFRIVVVGPPVDARYAAALATELRRCDVGALVEVRPAVSTAEMVAIYAECDALLLPTLEEGFGKVLVEAALMGKPAVAYATGGVPEFLVSQRNALLVPTDDEVALVAACERLVRDRCAARRLGDRAQRDLRTRFRPEPYALWHRGLYARCLEARSGGVAGVAAESLWAAE